MFGLPWGMEIPNAINWLAIILASGVIILAFIIAYGDK